MLRHFRTLLGASHSFSGKLRRWFHRSLSLVYYVELLVKGFSTYRMPKTSSFKCRIKVSDHKFCNWNVGKSWNFSSWWLCFAQLIWSVLCLARLRSLNGLSYRLIGSAVRLGDSFSDFITTGRVDDLIRTILTGALPLLQSYTVNACVLHIMYNCMRVSLCFMWVSGHALLTLQAMSLYIG